MVPVVGTIVVPLVVPAVGTTVVPLVPEVSVVPGNTTGLVPGPPEGSTLGIAGIGVPDPDVFVVDVELPGPAEALALGLGTPLPEVSAGGTTVVFGIREGLALLPPALGPKMGSMCIVPELSVEPFAGIPDVPLVPEVPGTTTGFIPGAVDGLLGFGTPVVLLGFITGVTGTAEELVMGSGMAELLV